MTKVHNKCDKCTEGKFRPRYRRYFWGRITRYYCNNCGRRRTIVPTYYSGQGKFYTATRDADGKPTGFQLLGNIPALGIQIDIKDNR